MTSFEELIAILTGIALLSGSTRNLPEFGRHAPDLREHAAGASRAAGHREREMKG